ncbi:MAG: relaxase MobL [Oscillospiraceae bacterium]|nr:relaxase MobL [Oscillospiraceae bacterium]
MPKVIFTSRYIKGGRHAANLARYIATRDGVDVARILNPARPATENQRRLISEILRAAPEAKDSFEYEDYAAAPTIGNASEFITSAFENMPELWGGVRNYVDYIARRPGAERSAAGHGLFGGCDDVVLSRVCDEVEKYRGNIWTHVVSLRREDAERLGYDNAAAWRSLVMAKTQIIADAMKIPIDNLVWYGAFHRKESNPHIHLLVWSKNPSEGYLTEPQIEKLRAAFASELYRNELLHIYERKDRARSRVKAFAGERLDEIIAQIQNGAADPAIVETLARLSEKLKSASGKKQYGYLRPEVKRLVDELVARLAADPRISEMYEHWRELTGEVRRFYTNAEAEPVPLADEKTFKSVKNMVIQYALELTSPEAEPEEVPRARDTPPPETTGTSVARIKLGSGVPLLLALARMIRASYQQQQKNFERLADSKLLLKIRRKKQELGQKMDM